MKTKLLAIAATFRCVLVSTNIVAFLASCLVSLAQTNPDKNAPFDATEQLLGAAGSGDTETIKLMLNKGADVNAKDNLGMTALMCAAVEGQTNVVELLLDKGADINAKDNDGRTALMWAATLFINPTTGLLEMSTSDDRIKMVKLLLAKGADINAVNKDGQTALDLARARGARGNATVVQLLQQAASIPASVIGMPVNAVVASGTNTDTSGYVTNAALLTPFTLTNSAGNVVTDAVLYKLMPNKFIYKTPRGEMATRRLDSLSKELQKRFGYDAASAAAQDAIEAAAKMRDLQRQQSQRDWVQQQAELKEQSQSAVSDISSSIRAFAEKEWPGDYEMQRFVIDQQTEAYNWVVTSSSATGVPQEVFDQIKTKAASEWPDDYEMQKFEINQQVKAYTELH